MASLALCWEAISSYLRTARVKKNFICPDFPQPTRARVAPGPHLGRRFTVRLAVTLPPLIYGAGGSCGIGTPPIRCTHCIIEKWTYSPARARRPYWRDLARQVFALTFPRELGRRPQAVRKSLRRGLLGLVHRP